MPDKQLRLKITQEEYERVKEIAKNKGLSVSGYFKKAVSLEKMPKDNSPKVARELYFKLAELQNQIRAMIKGEIEPDLDILFEEIRNLRAECLGVERTE